MKNKIKISLVSISLLTTLNADILRIEGGAGVWVQNSSGESSYTNNGAVGKDTVTEQELNKGYAWVLFKQPVPLIPNLRLEYTNVEYNGKVSGELDGFPGAIPDGYFSNSNLTMDQFDIIPYYNILDNTFWVTVDLGLDIKVLNTEYNAGSIVEPNTGLTIFEGYNDSGMTVIPLGYVRARVQIPMTNIGFETDVKYVAYDGSSVTDFRAKIDYTLDMFPIVQPGLEIGYRYQKIDIDDEGTLSNLEFSGIYAGIMVRF